MVKIDELIKKLEKKCIKQDDAMPVLYVVHDPTKPIPNVVFHTMYPDLNSYGRVAELSKGLAQEIRGFFDERPEEVERIKELIREVREDR